MKVRALINYKDYLLNKDIIKGEDMNEAYNKAGVELTQERIDILLKGNASSNNKPFIEVEVEKKKPVVETADIQLDNVETAIVKPKKKKATNK